MACLNINNLNKHVDEPRVLAAKFSIDILKMNETKLNESIKSLYIIQWGMNVKLYINISYIELRIWNQVSYDPRSWFHILAVDFISAHSSSRAH